MNYLVSATIIFSWAIPFALGWTLFIGRPRWGLLPIKLFGLIMSIILLSIALAAFNVIKLNAFGKVGGLGAPALFFGSGLGIGSLGMLCSGKYIFQILLGLSFVGVIVWTINVSRFKGLIGFGQFLGPLMIAPLCVVCFLVIQQLKKQGGLM